MTELCQQLDTFSRQNINIFVHEKYHKVMLSKNI